MMNSPKLLASILDTIEDHITVVDQHGDIVYINHSWEMFGEDNDCPIKNWDHVNYLKICADAAAMGDAYGSKAATGIQQVIDGTLDVFHLEYPCHSPQEKRWFMMSVTPLHVNNTAYCAISHITITDRVLAEEKLLTLSQRDGLTGLYNRRYFDDFLHQEWLRCKRAKSPLSLAILDLDYFKRLNDRYGHPVGDDCLQKVAKAITTQVKRPRDLCARFGGEEIAIVMGDTDATPALTIANNILDTLRRLKIPNEDSSICPTLTASIGLATAYPHHTRKNEKSLIAQADELLYNAKGQGRDQIAHL